VGPLHILETGSPHVLALRYDWRGNSVLVVHNFDERPHEVRIDPGRDEELHADDSGVYRIALDALDFGWFRVGGLDYAVRRESD
jgi:maltose alpha-D-glucosyltransferase / alpha-amylase